MSFVKENANLVKIEDTVFKIVKLAKKAKEQYGPDAVVDATIGSLYGEDGTLVAYNTVFDTLNGISSRTKAAYAGSFTGNDNYREQVCNWLFGDIHLNLAKTVIATPGGTGAVNMTMTCCLQPGQTVLLPEVAWGSYKLMAQEYGLQTKTYSLFENDAFHLNDFRLQCKEVMDAQHKLVVVINDPCHNPTGYSLTGEEWEGVISILNECGKQGPVILLNDIAYLDYSYNLNTVHKYMENFNNISDRVAVVIAFSCSKTLTSYGLRIGAAVVLAQHQQDVDTMETVFEKMARCAWSNINNSGMENFVQVTTTHREQFEKEKAVYIDYLKKRSSILVEEARQCGLPIYPYKEG
ncbi:MAG: aminotransferase class I/II-fold pyridoxal phosphate-dependent enzyme, partial [Erysipelotrichaceae bacterium]|nr:aminotransferase class I/II-fold pyridoxal phosphate-dependent enzyme [Erysipelotrichaceae bacterium]